jgi:hypothetical protein
MHAAFKRDPSMASIAENNDAHRGGTISVSGARVHVRDKAAVKALLAPVPDAHLVRRRLKRGGYVQHWDCALEVDFWVFSNGKTMACLAIEGLSVDEAERSRRLFTDRCRVAGHGRIAWIEDILREATHSPLTLH